MATAHRQLNLKSEADRYKTFRSWPVPFMDPRKMAQAGFYYYNRADKVKCFFCGVELYSWQEGDDPLKDHQKWQSTCPFIRNMHVGNIPVSSNTNSSPPGEVEARRNDECGPYDWRVLPISSRQNSVNSNETPLEKLGINVTRGPFHVEYATQESRLKSFSSWPISIKQRAENLSEAGFFYTGNGDRTICFHCGGGLQDWEEADDPWTEHVKWFPKCSFVRLNKGLQFVAKVSGKQVSPISPTTMKNIQIPSELKEVLHIKKPIEESMSSSETEEKISSASQDNNTDDSHLCKICCEGDLSVVFLPCGHLVACVKCASALSTCPVCRQSYTATLRVYLS